MKTVGMFQAKTHFSELIENLAIDHPICITKRGKEIAMIISIDEYRKANNENFWKRWNDLKKRIPLYTPEEIIEMKNEGRR